MTYDLGDDIKRHVNELLKTCSRISAATGTLRSAAARLRLSDACVETVVIVVRRSMTHSLCCRTLGSRHLCALVWIQEQEGKGGSKKAEDKRVETCFRHARASNGCRHKN
ncbi:hypothetical protein PsYK624_029160 [Phanerochaete sordida]|uniref:Uncharacterized protein n=1 Tax=Phanerochaete sordida TaxID=48140 RepID=A0A9P3LAB7_9APHY|nr:hypothetical protein PsYK624_029160 [Phanerochaete sordida]